MRDVVTAARGRASGVLGEVLLLLPAPPVRGRLAPVVRRRLNRHWHAVPPQASTDGTTATARAARVSRRLVDRGDEDAAVLVLRAAGSRRTPAAAHDVVDRALQAHPDSVAVAAAALGHLVRRGDADAVRPVLARLVAAGGADVPAGVLVAAAVATQDMDVAAEVDGLVGGSWGSVTATVRHAMTTLVALHRTATDGTPFDVDVPAGVVQEHVKHVVDTLVDRGDLARLHRLTDELPRELLISWSARQAAMTLRRAGDLTLSTSLAHHALVRRPDDPAVLRLIEVGESSLGVLADGWSAPSPSAAAYAPAPRTVGYLLHNSLPHASAGYATRTHGLLTALVRSGWTVHGATRLGYPLDTWDENDTREPAVRDDLDGVAYHRFLDGRRPYRKWPLGEYLEGYVARVEALAREHRLSVPHGASNYWNGMAAVTAARNLGLPAVYEVRGLWELTRISRDPGYEDSELFELTATLEAQTCRAADRVIAITGALRDEMVRRGVPAETISVLPNGVDSHRFVPRPRDESLADSLGVRGKVVIGYVGSLLDYEGIDMLLRATRELRRRRSDFHVLVVGAGAAEDDVRALHAELGLDDVVTFTGRVPHDEVERYYSLVDVAPFPRKPLPVCEAVSPLKPFEAMAMGKVPVVSSVAALTEIVTDGETGLVFDKGDVASLTDVLDRIVDDGPLRTTLGAAAREWVERERDWSVLVRRLDAVYADLSG